MIFEMNKMWKLAKKPVIVCMGIDTSLSMAANNDMQDVKDAALVRTVTRQRSDASLGRVLMQHH